MAPEVKRTGSSESHAKVFLLLGGEGAIHNGSAVTESSEAPSAQEQQVQLIDGVININVSEGASGAEQSPSGKRTFEES